MEYKYIHHPKNWVLALYKMRWLRGGTGIFILLDDSGSGKSVFLNQLKKDIQISGQKFSQYTAEEILDMVKAKLLYGKKEEFAEPERVILIEDFDLLYRKALMREIVLFLTDWHKKGRLIICTAIKDNDIIPPSIKRLHIHKIPVDYRLIRKIVCQKNISLSKTEMKRLQKSSKDIVTLQRNLNSLMLEKER